MLQAGSPPEEFRFSETVAVRARIALLQVLSSMQDTQYLLGKTMFKTSTRPI